MTVPRFGTSFEAISRFADLADYSIAFAIRAIGGLGVADHLADGPKTVTELAAATGTHAPSLLRAMRALVSKDVFAEPTPGTFELTPVGDLLRSDHPLSMRMAFRLYPDVRALAELTYSLRTGKPAFDKVFGMPYWDYLRSNPAELEEFQDSQRALTRLELLSILRTYRWSKLTTVVDVGGNDGTFLASLLLRNPAMTGTLFDLRDTVAAAAKTLADAGVTDRCTVVAGNAFDTEIPAGADAYLTKRVLVGMGDEEAVNVLRGIRAAMRDDSRLLILEPVIHSEDDINSDMDVLMLVLGDGRVRTTEEHRQNLAKAGLELTRVLPARPSSIVEARPA
jgi:O-methyltransferase domain